MMISTDDDLCCDLMFITYCVTSGCGFLMLFAKYLLNGCKFILIPAIHNLSAVHSNLFETLLC